MTFTIHIPHALLWFLGGFVVAVVIGIAVVNLLAAKAVGKMFGW